MTFVARVLITLAIVVFFFPRPAGAISSNAVQLYPRAVVLVPSATWQAPDGRIGVVLANFADLGESPRVELQGEGEKNVTLYLDGQKSERTLHLPTVIDLEMEPRSIALIEVK